MMRVERLSLDRFGHFTDKVFDFGPRPAGTPDFHIVHGPNEAGKTTTMEGWLRLLYGYARGEPYGFLHQREALSVSAQLDIDGASRVFRRLPRKNLLQDASGATLPEAALSGALMGVDADAYRSLFCLDDATIESGGEEIVRARGDIGRLLFSAAAGVGDLTALLDGLRAEADGLYRRSAPSTRFHTQKKALKETEAEIRARDVTHSALRRLRAERDAAQAQEDSVSAERRALLQQAAALEAEASALPMLSDLDALEAALAPLADHPTDPGVTSDDVLDLMQQAARADDDLRRLDTEAARLEQERAALPLSPEVLAQAERLTALEPLYHRATAGAADLGKRQRAAEDLLAEMTRLAAGLTGAAEVDAMAFLPSDTALAVLEEKREALRAAEATVRTEAAEVEALREARAEAQAKAEDEAPTDPIAQVFRDAPVERLALAAESARTALREAERTAREALDALALPGQRFDAPPELPLSPEEAESRHQAWQEADRKRARLTEEAATLATRRAALDREIAGLHHSGPADDAATREARQARESLWQDHRATLTPDSAALFEAAMLRLDALMEGRLEQADTLAALRQAEAARAEAQEAEAALQRDLAATRDDLRRIEAEHAATLSHGGIGCPLPLPALAAWLRRAEAARAASLGLAREEARHAEVLSDARAVADRLRPILGSESDDVTHLARLAQERHADWQARAETARRGAERVRELTTRLQSRERRLAAADDRLAQAREAWRDALAEALPSGVDGEALLATLKPLHALRERAGAREPVLRQIAGIEQDRTQFRAAVDALPEALAPSHGNAEQRFLAAQARLAEAREAQARHATLTTRLRQIADERADADHRAKTIAARVASLLAAFPQTGTPGPDALRTAVRGSERARDLRERIDGLTRRLMQTLSCGSLDEVRDRLAGRDAPGLEAARSETEANRERLEADYRAAIAARTEAEAALKTVTGGPEVAELEARAAVEALEVGETALDHLRLSLGHRLAEEALRRYRDSHRSEMMQATETAFAELTNGAYRQLRTEMDGSTEVLLALDDRGAAKQVGDMSKGTRFQLYLALRAAAYEELARQGICLPFFCDDIFETFDEERTRAACRVLARIGMTGQAIYLTHHRHVVEIAREVCGEALRVHDLRETTTASG